MQAIKRLFSKLIPAVALLAALLFAAALRADDISPTTKKNAATAAPVAPAPAATATKSEPAPATDAVEPNVVSGTIYTDDGSPVAGATVVLYGRGNRSATSSTIGEFRFDKVAHMQRNYLLLAHHGNLITDEVKITKLPSSKPKADLYAPLRLTMHDGKQVQLALTSKDTGKPVVGARVRLGYPDPRLVLSDKHGVVLVEGLLPKKYTFGIYCDGFARSSLSVDLAKSPTLDEHKMALPSGGIIRGVVVDDKGKPLPGVNVYFSNGSNDWYQGDAPNTDKNGKFQDRFVPFNRPTQISLNKDKYEIEGFDGNQKYTLSKSKRLVDLHIVMRRLPGGYLTGTVIDTAGRPIVGASITVLGIWNKTFPTDAKGHFKLDDIAVNGNWGGGGWLGVRAKRYAPQTMSPELGTTAHPTDITIKLEPGHKLHLRVVDDQGKPVQHVIFQVRSSSYPQGGDWNGPHRETLKDGTFFFDSLPADAQFSVQTPWGLNIWQTTFKLDSPEEVVYKLDPPGMIRGKLVDAETGKPLPNFHVKLQGSQMREAGDIENANYSGNLSDSRGKNQPKDGTFKFEHVPCHVGIELIAEADGYEREVVPHITPMHADQAIDLQIVMLPLRESDYSTIRGQLLDYQGKGISGVNLRLIVATRAYMGTQDWQFSWQQMEYGQLERQTFVERFEHAVTDSHGRFEFKRIPPGKYVQVAYWGEGVPKNRWFSNDKTRPGKDTTLSINIPKPARVHVTIDRIRLTDVGSVNVEKINDWYLQNQVSFGEKQKTCDFTDLGPGQYWVQVYSKPKQVKQNGMVNNTINSVASQQITIVPGETKEIHFDTPDKPAPGGVF